MAAYQVKLTAVRSALRPKPNSVSTQRRQRLGQATKMMSVAGVAGFLASACAIVDTFNPRAYTMNHAMTNYRNEATLLNIVRASQNEPMNFVALTGATGHSSFGGSQGLPTVTVGPDLPVINAVTNPTRNYGFGPNSLNESSTVDFTVSLLDDPQSYAASMTPLDPAMMGFFFGRNWSVPLLLPLFVSEIRIIPHVGRTSFAFFGNPRSLRFIFCRKNPPDVAPYLQCDRRATMASDSEIAEQSEECRAGRAYCVPAAFIIFLYLQDRGFTVHVPAGSTPGQQQQAPPQSRICFDSVYGGVSRRKSFSASLNRMFGLSEEDVLNGDFADSTGPTDRNTRAIVQHSRCDDPDTPWIKPAASPAGTGLSSQSSSQNATAVASVIADPAAANQSQNAPMYEFYDEKSRSVIQIFTRSTWGMYQFLGDVVRFQDDNDLFRIAADGSADCFTSVSYSGVNYCVPRDAPNAKMILSLLHELVNLYTRPNNTPQPNSGTTRVTPG
jgi:hypothetical protein